MVTERQNNRQKDTVIESVTDRERDRETGRVWITNRPSEKEDRKRHTVITVKLTERHRKQV